MHCAEKGKNFREKDEKQRNTQKYTVQRRVSYQWHGWLVFEADFDYLRGRNQRNHGHGDSEHEPADAARPVRVDVVSKRHWRVVHHGKHEHKL